MLAAVAGAAAPATAATVMTPAKPAAIRLAAATGSSFTVASAPATYARGYRVFASATKSDVYMVNIIARARRSAISTSPRITMAGLPYTSAPYFYRVQAINGTKVRWSDIQTGYVRPDTPSTAHATGAASTGLSLAWGGRTAGRYVVTQATNAAMTAGVRSYSITSQAHRFTPYDLHKGTRYYFRVRAYNGSVASSPSAQTQLVAPARGQNVRVMTWNVLHRAAEGTREGTETVASWTQRRVPMVALIKKENPDVIGLQEAGDWIGAVKGPRVVDDLRARLGVYTLAHTEVTPGQAGWFRTFRYILYPHVDVPGRRRRRPLGAGAQPVRGLPGAAEPPDRGEVPGGVGAPVPGRGPRRRPGAAGRDAEAARLRPVVPGQGARPGHLRR